MTPAEYKLLSELQQRLSAPEDFEPWCRQTWATELQQLLERNEARVFGNDVVMLLDEAEPVEAQETEGKFIYNTDVGKRNIIIFGDNAVDDEDTFTLSLYELHVLLKAKFINPDERHPSAPTNTEFYDFGKSCLGATVRYEGYIRLHQSDYKLCITGISVNRNGFNDQDYIVFNDLFVDFVGLASNKPDRYEYSGARAYVWWS